MDAAKPIGIFDSGIGGLTVVREIQALLPNETLCYFGDTARVPYGTKSPDTIIRYSEEITDFLKSHDVKLILVACNTVSSVALPAIQQRFDGPVTGVVAPGVKAAIKATRANRVGIIGTKSTITSGSYQNGLKQINPAIEVCAQACPLFVPFAEEGWLDGEEVKGIAKRYLNPLKEKNIDTLILGCTHYPLLQEMIQSVMGSGVGLINSAKEAAHEVKSVLEHHNGLNTAKKWKNQFYASDDIAHFKTLCERICPNGDKVFAEVNADFFTVVQKIHQLESIHLKQGIQWFTPLHNGD